MKIANTNVEYVGLNRTSFD